MRKYVFAVIVVVLLAACQRNNNNPNHIQEQGDALSSPTQAPVSPASGLEQNYASPSPQVLSRNEDIPDTALREIRENILLPHLENYLKYPEEYAGYYTENDPPMLVICLTGLDEKQKYCDATQYDGCLKFMIAEHSMNTLIQNKLIVQAAYEQHFNNIVVEPDYENNCLMVRALKEDFEKVKSFDTVELGIEDIKDMLRFDLWWNAP